jgi:hypothetical protein
MNVTLDLTHIYELAKAEEEKKRESEICTFEGCGFYAARGTGYCAKHTGRDTNISTCIEFLKVLVDNPVLLLNFVQAGSFFMHKHDGRTCQHGHCDDCYSGDHDEEEADSVMSATKAIFDLMPVPTNDTDAEDESEE